MSDFNYPVFFMQAFSYRWLQSSILFPVASPRKTQDLTGAARDVTSGPHKWLGQARAASPFPVGQDPWVSDVLACNLFIQR